MRCLTYEYNEIAVLTVRYGTVGTVETVEITVRYEYSYMKMAEAKSRCCRTTVAANSCRTTWVTVLCVEITRAGTVQYLWRSDASCVIMLTKQEAQSRYNLNRDLIG